MIRIVTLLLLVFTSSIFAQLSISSLNQIYDAASVSLGEASVANRHFGIPSNINPALLSEQDDLILYYNQRSIDWMESLKDLNFFTIGVQIPTSLGNFVFNYKKFDQGKLNLYSPEGPEVVGKVEVYDQTFEVMYGKKIYENLSAGAVFKLFTLKNEIDIGSDKFEFNTPMFLDLGLTYKIDGIISSQSFNDDLIFGIDIKNFGTDFIQTHHDKIDISNIGASTEENIIKVERYLRIGFGYNLEINSENNSNVFHFTFSAEYKNQLNTFYNNKSRRDYWGMGMAASFYEIVALRIGAIANPYTSIYGHKGVFNARYGIEIQTPKINAIENLPFKIVFDYAVIPIIQIGYFANNKNRKNLEAFNISLRFPGIRLL